MKKVEWGFHVKEYIVANMLDSWHSTIKVNIGIQASQESRKEETPIDKRQKSLF